MHSNQGTGAVEPLAQQKIVCQISNLKATERLSDKNYAINPKHPG